MFSFRKRFYGKQVGQSTLELAMLFIVVVAVLVIMRRFLQGSVISSVKQHSDEISESKFDPDALESYSEESHSTATVTTTIGPMGRIDKTINKQHAWGSSNVVLSKMEGEALR